MDTIHVVSKGEYSDYRVLAVYSTKEKAEEAVAEFNKYQECESEKAEIETLPFDMPIESCKRISLRMRKDGTVVDGSVEREFGFDRLGFASGLAYDGNMYFRSFGHHDEERAIKAANERRCQLIASDKWGDRASDKWGDRAWQMSQR